MASKLCGVPINSFNFYVQKIRYNLQLSSSLNKISQKVSINCYWIEFKCVRKFAYAKSYPFAFLGKYDRCEMWFH